IHKKLEQATRRLTKLVNYVGVATIENLNCMETKDYELELYPHLQVELPVTEWTVESVKLIYTQHKLRLEWAFLFGNSHGRYDAWRATSVNATPFICEKTESIRPKGHCVVVRVTIRDPDDGFKPNGGKVQELSAIGSLAEFYKDTGHLTGNSTFHALMLARFADAWFWQAKLVASSKTVTRLNKRGSRCTS
ncbi:hypothetical protein Tco_1177464, partial [Tanacetum coccineum]